MVLACAAVQRVIGAFDAAKLLPLTSTEVERLMVAELETLHAPLSGLGVPMPRVEEGRLAFSYTALTMPEAA